MKVFFSSILFFVMSALQANAQSQLPIDSVISKALVSAERQSILLAEKYVYKDGLLPRTYINGKDIDADSHWWTSGFFGGTLWRLYEHGGNEKLKDYAIIYTSRVEKEKQRRDMHDIGFIINCSFGNGYRITGYSTYKDVMLTGANSLASRFNPRVGLIRSWDFNKDKWQYPVIIDNMMNLELLLWAASNDGGKKLRQMAESHADKTMRFHYRPDMSCFHVVSYDTITGRPHIRQTFQGYSDNSAWARGQMWGLYGYTMMYRETKKVKYLRMAKAIAKYLINQKNMPEDGVPYWDFDAPDIPKVPRDASSAAIMASALIELSRYVNNDLKKEYLEMAEKQIRTLASPEYTAAQGENGDFILKHSIGSIPHHSEVDVPLTYADYYYVEALMRYENLLTQKK